jgi:hypothetical protein
VHSETICEHLRLATDWHSREIFPARLSSSRRVVVAKFSKTLAFPSHRLPTDRLDYSFQLPINKITHETQSA